MNEKPETREESNGGGASISWSDERLVRGCLSGTEQAWTALIDKYKNLIFSIPIKYGVSRDDAADILQSVCLELLSELSNLKKPGAVRSWLITVTVRKTFRWKRRMRRRLESLRPDEDPEALADGIAPRDFVEELERGQMVRDAVAHLPPRCRELIRLLFYEQPPVPYSEVAQRLSLALGSIGFIRGRCLRRLTKLLQDQGFD
jgi:RNA polymerase sigma factor (sigma-70 family)